MAWVDLVVVAALVQLFAFGFLVARARGIYHVKAPAVAGNDMFERYYRVQMNTLELLVLLVPALYMAARYWSPGWVAATGAVYVLGRLVYLRAYITDPRSRTLGFALSAFPILGLLAAAFLGAIKGVLA
jgi:glutathione S-transferase